VLVHNAVVVHLHSSPSEAVEVAERCLGQIPASDSVRRLHSLTLATKAHSLASDDVNSMNAIKKYIEESSDLLRSKSSEFDGTNWVHTAISSPFHPATPNPEPHLHFPTTFRPLEAYSS